MLTMEDALGIQTTTQKVTTTPGKNRRQQRYEETIDLMLNTELTPTKIAEQVGVSRKTVYKYWAMWQETEEATRVRRKWHKLCKYLEAENPEEAFRGLTKIVYRMTTEKRELKVKKFSISKQVSEIIKFSREQIDATDTSGDIKL